MLTLEAHEAAHQSSPLLQRKAYHCWLLPEPEALVGTTGYGSLPHKGLTARALHSKMFLESSGRRGGCLSNHSLFFSLSL